MNPILIIFIVLVPIVFLIFFILKINQIKQQKIEDLKVGHLKDIFCPIHSSKEQRYLIRSEVKHNEENSLYNGFLVSPLNIDKRILFEKLYYIYFKGKLNLGMGDIIKVISNYGLTFRGMFWIYDGVEEDVNRVEIDLFKAEYLIKVDKKIVQDIDFDFVDIII